MDGNISDKFKWLKDNYPDINREGMKYISKNIKK